MANTFNAITTGTGGVATTGDSSGAFSFTKDGGSSELYLDASGNVGIGSSSTYGYKMFILGSSGSGLGVFDGTNTGYILGNGTTVQFGTPNSVPVAFNTGGTERMRIDSNGIITGTAGNLQLISGTAVASTSGTSITFTGIPSWVKRITVMLQGVSTSGSSNLQVQIGSGSVTSSGYIAASRDTTVTSAGGSFTAGFGISSASAANILNGHMTLTNVSSNLWLSSHTIGFQQSTSGYAILGGGYLSLGGALDRVRITTVNGTDTFDAGSINIMYE